MRSLIPVISAAALFSQFPEAEAREHFIINAQACTANHVLLKNSFKSCRLVAGRLIVKRRRMF